MTKRRLTPADIAALAWPPDNEKGEALAAKWENAETIDPAELLGDVTGHLAAELFRSSPSQKAALSGAVLKALEAFQVLRPSSISHYIDVLLSHPNFGPLEFVDELKRAYGSRYGTETMTYRKPPE